MKFELKNNFEMLPKSTIAETLAKLDAKAEPIRVCDFIGKLHNPVRLLDMTFQAIAQLRESLSKQSVIFDSVTKAAFCCLDMRASLETCYLAGEDELPNIIMSYDIFTCENTEKTTELLFSCLAQLIEYKVYNTTVKRFHWQLIYYLMGFDPVKASMEKAEAKKLLGV